VEVQLVGLRLNAILGWRWADPVAAWSWCPSSWPKTTNLGAASIVA